MARDPGYNVGLQATGLGLTVGAMLYTAHAEGLAAMDCVNQERVDAQHAANLQAERQNHRELAALARELASRLAASESENARLRKALAQRQAYIDRMRQA